MLLPKKLTFQLTPLLDLLLIVIFAQYMEMQQTSAKAEKEVSQRAEEKTTEAESTLKRAEDREREAERKLAELENKADSARSELEKKLAEMSEELEREFANRETVRKLIAQLFNIDSKVLEEMLKSDTHRMEKEKQELRELMKQLADARKNEAFKHLLTHNAMRKRVDVWNLFITKNGTVELQAGEKQVSFRFTEMTQAEYNTKALSIRMEADRLKFQSEVQAKIVETFKTKFSNSVGSFDQPKSIVVVLLSWEKGTKDYYYLNAETALDSSVFKLNSDGDTRSYFVKATLGTELSEEKKS